MDGGTFDEDALERLAEATPHMREVALRKAEIARFLIKGGVQNGCGISRAILTAARQTFDCQHTDRAALRKISLEVEGVDPINFAPALLPLFTRKGGRRAEISEEAWSFFMTVIRDAVAQYPLVEAWRDVRDVASKRRWQWPTQVTVWRRWNALSEA